MQLEMIGVDFIEKENDECVKGCPKRRGCLEL